MGFSLVKMGPNETYPHTYKAGDRVKCLINQEFVGGERHHKGQVLTVTEETRSYYTVWSKYYIPVN